MCNPDEKFDYNCANFKYQEETQTIYKKRVVKIT